MVVGVLSLAVASPASGSIITGKLSGSPIPSGESGRAVVRASNLTTGRVAAAVPVGPTAGYRLTVPKGGYALLPAVLQPGTPFVRAAATRVRIGHGKRKTVVVSTRRKKPNGAILQPIVGIPDNAFAGATGEFAPFNRGIGAMLITDIFGAAAQPGCLITVVEVSAQFEAAYQLELRLARLGLIDPATAVQPGRRIRPTRGIRGRITVSGDRMVISAEVYKWSNRRTLGRTSVEGPADSVFELEQRLATRLVDLLCDKAPPISGTFSGSLDYSKLLVAPVGIQVSWEGNVDMVPQTSIGGIPIPPRVGQPTTYLVRSGSLTATVRGTGIASGCTMNGTRSFDAKGLKNGADVLAMSVTEGDPDTYRLVMSAGAAAIPTVLSGCSDPADEGKAGTFPLLAVAVMAAFDEHATTDEGVFAGAASRPGSASDGAYTWSWNFRS